MDPANSSAREMPFRIVYYGPIGRLITEGTGPFGREIT